MNSVLTPLLLLLVCWSIGDGVVEVVERRSPLDVGVERGEVVKFHVNWGGWECGSVSGRRRLG